MSTVENTRIQLSLRSGPVEVIVQVYLDEPLSSASLARICLASISVACRLFIKGNVGVTLFTRDSSFVFLSIFLLSIISYAHCLIIRRLTIY